MLKRVLRAQEIRERRIPKTSAHKNPSTANPGTIKVAPIIRSALITKVNNPKVTSVIGRVSITKIGLIIALIIPRTTARTRAVIKFSTCTPGRRYAAARIAKALSNQLIKIPITSIYSCSFGKIKGMLGYDPDAVG